MIEFPKMLYRDGKLPGTQKVRTTDDVYFAVAVDKDEQADMLDAGFRFTVEPEDKPKSKAKKSEPAKETKAETKASDKPALSVKAKL